MRRRKIGPAIAFVLAIFLSLACSLAFADEGMWLYNAFPTDKVKAEYGAQVTQSWLDHLRLSSVKFSNGGSGSFVSSDGLVLTNQHMAHDCIANLSSSGKDYIADGFYAHSRAGEPKCPNLELDQLLAIKDVTSNVNAAAHPDMTPADAQRARRGAMATIEQQNCASSTGLRCNVVTLYSGGAYNLYEYKKFTDVRLVFAPETDVAFFGGDPENFTYPRYDFDFAFLRVYENGQPAHLDNYLRVSQSEVKEGDLVFLSGHPGTTNRLLTLAQLQFLRNNVYPLQLSVLRRRIAALQRFSAVSQENARIANEDLFFRQNSFKALTGYLKALDDKSLMAAKARDENSMRAFVVADPDLKAEIGDPWAAIAKAEETEKGFYVRYAYLDRLLGFDSTLGGIARNLVRVSEEKTKPNNARLREYADAALPALEQQIFSTAPIYKSLEIATLTDSLADMQQALGANDPIVQKILAGKSPAEVAKNLIEETKLDNVAVRKRLYEGGTVAIEASSDPLIVLMRTIDPDARTVRARLEDEVAPVICDNGPKIATARFAKLGFSKAPDATGSLRISFGIVKGYKENGAPVVYTTTIGDLYQHAAEHGNQAPYHLPADWTAAKSKMNLAAPVDFVTTDDSIGGNSGSPVVDRDGNLVGVLFDGNIESLANNFFYDDTVQRSINVDVRGILEALRKIYGAASLSDELTTGALPPGNGD